MRTAFIILLLLAAAACRDAGTDVPDTSAPVPGSPPIVTGVFPDSAAVGDPILLVGSRFGDPVTTSVVSVGGATAAAVSEWSSTRIVATVPLGAATGSVFVTVGGVASNSISFRVKPTAESRMSYANNVLPLLTSNGCTGCHGGNGNLVVSPYASLMAGTSDHGPVVTPYNGEGSILVKKLRGTAGFGSRMPFGGQPLSDANIELIARWIKQGAKNN